MTGSPGDEPRGWFERFLKTDPLAAATYRALRDRDLSEGDAREAIRQVFRSAYQTLRTETADIADAYDRLVKPQLQKLIEGGNRGERPDPSHDPPNGP